MFAVVSRSVGALSPAHPRSDAAPLPALWVVTALGIALALTLALLADAGLTVGLATPGAWVLLGWLALNFGLAAAFRHARTPWRRAVREGALHFGIFSTMVLAGAVASYPVAAMSSGYVDGALTRIDHGFGFEWTAWYAVVAAHPLLQIAGRLAYDSVYISPALLLGWFAWERRTAQARAFLLSFWLAAVITLALYVLMPAAGPLATEWHGPIGYMPESALWQPVLIPALRAHQLRVVDLGGLRGLVSAPSFHAAAAILYVRAAWPMRLLRWPLLLVNAAVLLSTPVEGTHYFIDLLLGALVALTAAEAVDALAIARRPARRRRADDRAALGTR